MATKVAYSLKWVNKCVFMGKSECENGLKLQFLTICTFFNIMTMLQQPYMEKIFFCLIEKFSMLFAKVTWGRGFKKCHSLSDMLFEWS